MKQNKLRVALPALAALVAISFAGCRDPHAEQEHHFDNKLYVSSDPVYSDLFISPEYSSASRTIAVRLAMPAAEDVTVTFEARPELAAEYDMIYGDNAGALPAANYSIPQTTCVISKGAITPAGDVTVEFTNTDKLDKNSRYVLPVRVASVSGAALLESARTVYFVFKGAALINVVANVWGMNFPIQWSATARPMVTGMTAVTIEALVRSRDWEGGRGNALSTVFGIEGQFLVRIGDADRPRNQLQLVSPAGNWPAPNAAPGLPVDRFVHIAVVYDTESHERIYYIDGKQVAYETGTVSRTVSLANGCYIGFAWDDTRWMPGEMAEVRVWNYQRTAEQIAANPYWVNPASDGLVAYWKFNEGSGNVIKDATGNGTDLTGRAATGAFPDGSPFTDTPSWVPVVLPAPVN